MKPTFLFPYRTRFLGYGCIIGHVPVTLIGKMYGVDKDDHDPGLFNHAHLFFMGTALLMLIGLFLVAFAKEKIEDEQIWQLRLESLRWAIYLNYIILVVSLIVANDTEHILELNLWVPLLFFIIRFRAKIYQLNRLMAKEGNGI